MFLKRFALENVCQRKKAPAVSLCHTTKSCDTARRAFLFPKKMLRGKLAVLNSSVGNVKGNAFYVFAYPRVTCVGGFTFNGFIV